jgi:predicted ATP-binding protein involved in virulence
MLGSNGCINGSTFLIIDEPEAHLHPQWQIQMAELLVSLAEHTPVKILINTKSPYIIEAVRVYSQITGMEEETRFYHVVETGVFESSLQDVSDDISPIYEALAEPYRTLDRVYGKNETQSIDNETAANVITTGKPICIAKDGLNVVDDCGNVSGYIEMLQTIHEGEREDAHWMREWARSQGWTGRDMNPKHMI